MVDLSNEPVLRMHLQDDWSLNDFAQFLRSVEETYDAILSWRVVAQNTEIEKLERRLLHLSPFSVDTRYDDVRDFLLDGRLSSSHQRRTLRIGKIQIASAGLIEFIGQLNPLNTISEFILRWRQQSHDQKIRLIEIREERAADRRRHVEELLNKQIELAKALDASVHNLHVALNSLKKEERKNAAEKWEEHEQLFNRIIETIQNEIVRCYCDPLVSLANDSRIESAELIRPENQ